MLDYNADKSTRNKTKRPLWEIPDFAGARGMHSSMEERLRSDKNTVTHRLAIDLEHREERCCHCLITINAFCVRANATEDRLSEIIDGLLQSEYA